MKKNEKQPLPPVFIAFGGNLSSVIGTPLETMMAALEALAQRGVIIKKLSRFFQSPAWPAGSGPDYVNGVLQAQAWASPEMMLEDLHQIEAQFGRLRETRWGARSLDLDLVSVAETISPNLTKWEQLAALCADAIESAPPPPLTLPHPRAHQRAFVLVPLCDIAPEWQHPVLQKTAKQLVAALPEAEKTSLSPLSSPTLVRFSTSILQ